MVKEVFSQGEIRVVLSHRVIIEILSKITGDIVNRNTREGINCYLQYRRN